jgi:hypothetical protein
VKIGMEKNLSCKIQIQVFPDLNLTKFQVGFGTKSIFLIKIT